MKTKEQQMLQVKGMNVGYCMDAAAVQLEELLNDTRKALEANQITGTLEPRFPKGTKVWKLDSPKDKLSGTDTRGFTRWIYKVQRLRLSGGGDTGGGGTGEVSKHWFPLKNQKKTNGMLS